MALTVLTGGVRSGKSALAVRMATEATAPVVFVATAEAFDEDMATRIARHRRDRPAGWTVVEEARDLAKPLRNAPPDACVLVDCLTLWVNNLIYDGRSDGEIERASMDALECAGKRAGLTIVVTNEVGSGVHAPTETGRRYADVLGRVNASWARSADDAYLVVAGRTLRLT